MKKLLIILITIPLIFSSCEKEEEDNINNNNNNNNSIADNIVGEWINFGESGILNGNDISVFLFDPYNEDTKEHLNFFSDGTLQRYVSINGIVNNSYIENGTWQKTSNSLYNIYIEGLDGDDPVQESVTSLFYCDNNIFRTTLDCDLDYDYWQKDGYDYQICLENYVQQ